MRGRDASSGRRPPRDDDDRVGDAGLGGGDEGGRLHEERAELEERRRPLGRAAVGQHRRARAVDGEARGREPVRADDGVGARRRDRTAPGRDTGCDNGCSSCGTPQGPALDDPPTIGARAAASRSMAGPTRLSQTWNEGDTQSPRGSDSLNGSTPSFARDSSSNWRTRSPQMPSLSPISR